MGTFLKIVLIAWIFLIVIYAGFRLAGMPKEVAAKRMRIIDGLVFYGFVLLAIVVTLAFS